MSVNSFEEIFDRVENFVGVVTLVGIAVVLTWEFDVFTSSDIREIRFIEEVKVSDGKFAKFNHFEFKIDPENQRVIQKVIAPTKSSTVVFQKKRAESLGYHDQQIPQPILREFLSTLPGNSQIFKTLSNCVVVSTSDWSCADRIIGTDLQSSDPRIGMRDGEWVGAWFIPLVERWKTSWKIDKFKCGDVCYYGTTQENSALIRTFIGSQKSRTSEMPRVNDGLKE
jgi:hypothetical protein